MKKRLFILTAIITLIGLAISRIMAPVLRSTSPADTHQPLSSTGDRQTNQLNLSLKRLFDIVVSGTALVMLSGPMLIIALLVKLNSPGPIFYKATRVGRNGRLFKVYKYRSMVVDADKVGPRVTAGDDPRITRIGAILRKTKLDELPQLLNVLHGDMSLVGPRPEDPRYVAHYTPEQRNILKVRPGITGPASVAYRHEEEILRGAGDQREIIYINDIMPKKLAIDMEYVNNVSLGRDIQLLLDTVRAL